MISSHAYVTLVVYLPASFELGTCLASVPRSLKKATKPTHLLLFRNEETEPFCAQRKSQQQRSRRRINKLTITS